MITIDHGSCATHNVYGLDCAEFDRLRERADGACEQCGVAEEDTRHGRLHIDHLGPRGNPTSVRGLLCSPCNTSLGQSEAGRAEFTEAQLMYLAMPFGVDLIAAVPSEDEEAARRKLRRFAADRAKTAQAEVDAIVDALRLGVRQVDVMKDVDRSREYIRRIARDAEQGGRLPRRL